MSSHRNVLHVHLSNLACAWQDAYGVGGKSVSVSSVSLPNKLLYLGSTAAGVCVNPSTVLGAFMFDGKCLHNDSFSLEDVQLVLEENLLAKLEPLLAENKKRVDAQVIAKKQAYEEPYVACCDKLAAQVRGFAAKGKY